jgi:SAM-dependent methyltransferase
MSAEYDRFTRQYQLSKRLPFRIFSEIPDHLALLGDVTGLSVLDLACGDGFYTRRIQKAGAARVVGVDLSEGMIALARQQEAAEPLGITYLVSPVETLGPIGSFEVVSAAFLLNCAPTCSSLSAMARTIAANLEPGGRFVTTNSHLSDWPGVDYRPYGMDSDATAPLADGALYHITFLLDDDQDRFTIENFAHSRSAYEGRAPRGRPDRHPLALTPGDRGRTGRLWAGILARLSDPSPTAAAVRQPAGDVRQHAATGVRGRGHRHSSFAASSRSISDSTSSRGILRGDADRSSRKRWKAWLRRRDSTSFSKSPASDRRNSWPSALSSKIASSRARLIADSRSRFSSPKRSVFMAVPSDGQQFGLPVS